MEEFYGNVALNRFTIFLSFGEALVLSDSRTQMRNWLKSGKQVHSSHLEWEDGMWEDSAVAKSSKSCSGLQDEHGIAALFSSTRSQQCGELDHFGLTSALMILLGLFVLRKVLFERHGTNRRKASEEESCRWSLFNVLPLVEERAELSQ